MRIFWPALLVGGTAVISGCGPGGSRAARHANMRVLECSCAVAWPSLIRIIERANFRLVAKDEAGRIATFMWLGSQLPAMLRTERDRGGLAMAPDGSALQPNGLRMQSAVLTLTPRKRLCEAKISVSYEGRPGRWGGKWSGMESTGLLEKRLLFAFRLPPTESATRSGVGHQLSSGTEPTRTAQRLPGVSARTPGAPSEGIPPEADRTAVFELGGQ